MAGGTVAIRIWHGFLCFSLSSTGWVELFKKRPFMDVIATSRDCILAENVIGIIRCI